MEKGVRQLTDEGVAQLFTQFGGTKKLSAAWASCSLK